MNLQIARANATIHGPGFHRDSLILQELSLLVTAASQQPISLALAITELEPGGAEQCLVRLATRVDRRRFTPQVYALAPPPAEDKNALVRALEAASVPVHFLGATSAWHYWRTRRGLTELLRSQRPAVLQTFLYHANVLGASAARRAGVPHVFAGLRVAEPSRWRWMVERRALARAERLVCVSYRVEQMARERGLPVEKLVTVPNGIELAEYSAAAPASRASLGVPDDAPFLVSVGRLDKQKGYDFLIAAASRIFAELPRHHLVIAGEGPERATLERLAREHGVAERVHLVGYRTDVPAILHAADAFVLTSRYEGYSNALVEALASGLPFVALPTAVSRDDLGPLYARQVVGTRDPAQFVKLVVSVVEKPQIARALGEENRRFAEENLALETMVAAYENLWERAAASPR